MKPTGAAVTCQEITVPGIDGPVAELRFDLKEDSVNKFNRVTIEELKQAIDALKARVGLKGLVITSAKDCFIVGADITEFRQLFAQGAPEIARWLGEVNRYFSAIEDLPCPSVCAINGFALGGGMELALTASYRVMSSDTKVGLPETKLGIFPGWGGTVRLPRVIGADHAIEWIAGGEQWAADAALKVGAVDAVIPAGSTPEETRAKVRQAALATLAEAAKGRLDWKARREEKCRPLKLSPVEAAMAFETAKAFVMSKGGANYPAPIGAIEAMERSAALGREAALENEGKGFARVALTPQANAMVGVFLADQYLKKTAKKLAKGAKPVECAAVLGAGIMGGGIAYTTASKRIPIYMKDIAPKQLDLGINEAVKIMDKLVSRGKMTPAKLGETMGRIRPTLSLGDFKNVGFVVEAVVEREDVKRQVLAETEAAIPDGAILTSNTSTISITKLAESLKRPESFCGMHFFNPVHRMPLVEVIRGKKSSDAAISATVGYALALGKNVIVVNDCPGFFINRVLFPYFSGFSNLVGDGVDFQRVDKIMEKFGWPMGPAYLLDVVGIDTAVHCDVVMSGGFPDRMSHRDETPFKRMAELKRFGQKNGLGFYKYTPDKKGPPKKTQDPEAYAITRTQPGGGPNVSDQEIVDRMMLPMIIESARCIEDGIIGTPMEVDLGLLYGLGFPPFRGGAMRHADTVGLRAICEAADRLHPRLGKLYEPTPRMRDLAREGKGFYTAYEKGN